VLPLRTCVAFCAQGIFGAAMALVIGVYLSKFYVDVVLVPAGILALAVAGGRALDALIEPAVGYLTDHTRSRWGRRKPWILLGVLANAVTYYCLMSPPRELAPDLAVGWFLAGYGLTFVFSALSNVPRLALSVEFTFEARSRQRLYGVAAAFIAIGTIMGGVMPVVLDRLGVHDPHEQMQRAAALYVAGYLVLNLWFLRAIPERADFMGRGETPFVPGVRRALRNRPFRIMFASQVLGSVPVAIPGVVMPFFVEHVLKLDPLLWTGVYVMVFLGAGLLCLPAWLALARKIGKLNVWRIAGLIGLTGNIAMGFVGPGDDWWMLAIVTYVGTQFSVWLFVGGAMHADVIDYDELLTGKRREAQFSALWSIVPKFAQIPGAVLSLSALGAMGYTPHATEQSSAVLLTLRIMIAVVPSVFYAASLVVMWWYPLTERVHQEIRAGVDLHALGKAARDPITHELLLPPSQRTVDEESAWFLDNFSVAELRAARDRSKSVLPSVLGLTGASLGLMMLGLYYAFTSVETLSQDPGPYPPLAILLMGLGFSSFVFHALRIRPALAFARKPPTHELLTSHLGEAD
jgi:GPH family glycoside/pentoside/hexuronide:cation symporter